MSKRHKKKINWINWMFAFLAGLVILSMLMALVISAITPAG